jgi:hypothetical protein
MGRTGSILGVRAAVIRDGPFTLFFRSGFCLDPVGLPTVCSLLRAQRQRARTLQDRRGREQEPGVGPLASMAA